MSASVRPVVRHADSPGVSRQRLLLSRGRHDKDIFTSLARRTAVFSPPQIIWSPRNSMPRVLASSLTLWSLCFSETVQRFDEAGDRGALLHAVSVFRDHTAFFLTSSNKEQRLKGKTQKKTRRGKTREGERQKRQSEGRKEEETVQRKEREGEGEKGEKEKERRRKRRSERRRERRRKMEGVKEGEKEGEREKEGKTKHRVSPPKSDVACKLERPAR
ncbi:hypothetical protein TGME49_290645 [Toxoplasma gondii ME49]|uniref:Uncharacterized protein n=1 Tax=Toxoplasma gondii (strain ATCC 50611 / Me49) TaxID=508771 RepID=S8EX54_TOXGM|nr:hypothetical protein TGME49_290645 [Toxoplasma gondii ME49]EPT28031.1 hypothetical protein TGME49_290645 [Toxoplasma gondii ME49]|eukprot:XP_018636440.1 hypothetical protein TGME49_290645 [Toxoplasma gondii ME49]